MSPLGTSATLHPAPALLPPLPPLVHIPSDTLPQALTIQARFPGGPSPGPLLGPPSLGASALALPTSQAPMEK